MTLSTATPTFVYLCEWLYHSIMLFLMMLLWFLLILTFQDEIDRVRHRRQQREEEERLLEEQQAILAKEREQENFGEWQAREEAFHRNTTKQRTNIRLKQGQSHA